jgi:hypothetical protein
MSSAVCEWCSNYIDAVDNRRFPGFCSSEHRDEDRFYRDALASDRARRRADANQHRRATDARRNPHYLT